MDLMSADRSSNTRPEWTRDGEDRTRRSGEGAYGALVADTTSMASRRRKKRHAATPGRQGVSGKGAAVPTVTHAFTPPAVPVSAHGSAPAAPNVDHGPTPEAVFTVAQRSKPAGRDTQRWPAIREWPGVVISLIAAVLATAQFFLPTISVITKIGIAVGAIILGLYLSFKWSRKWPFAVAFVVTVVAWGSWTLVARPTAEQKYVTNYLRESRSANIWYGNAAMNPQAESYMVHHYSAFDPQSIAFPYDLPGAQPVELEALVRGMPMGEINGPIITMGQVASVSMVGLEPGRLRDPEYVVQLLPITPALREVWQTRNFGTEQMRNSTGKLADLYPMTARDQVRNNITVYVRIHPRPFPIPQDGDGMVVRGYPIAFGMVPTASGQLFQTVYLAGSSGTVYSRGQ